MNPNAANETCGLNREETIMEIIDKAANSANEAVDNAASATTQAAEALGKKANNSKMPSSNCWRIAAFMFATTP